MLDKLQLFKIKKLWHTCSETVVSFDLRRLPPYVRKDIPRREFELALELPVIPAGKGVLLVNENFSEHKMVRDILVALDTLPRICLETIYDMVKRRYPDAEKAEIKEGDSATEKYLKIIFMLCPYLLDAQKKDHL